MICNFCGKETMKKKVKKVHWHNEKLYIIENVDADVCKKCGEKYYHVTTLKKINSLIDNEHKEKIKEKLEVEVLAI